MIKSASTISSTGAITITGEGGGDGTGPFNEGVMLYGGSVESRGTNTADAATITIRGSGGNGTSRNEGVEMTGISPKVSSIAGDIHIIGEAGSGFSFGGVLLTRGVVESTATSKADSAKIIVEGTGKGGATGVTIGYRVTVSSETGDINVTGTGDEYGNGVNVRFGAAIESTGTVKAQAAKITILGTGGARAGAGVGIGNSIGYPDTKVASVAGDIQIVGGGAAYWVCQGIPTVLR